MQLLDHIYKSKRRLPEIRADVSSIYSSLLAESRWIREANFKSIHSQDLEFLFAKYDETFFDGLLSDTIQRSGSPISFRVSKRMTKVGGTTTRYRMSRGPGPRSSYEIAISSTLLFSTFYDIDRPVNVTGVECKDRVECLQRIFEHELIHLAEMLIWDDSSCSRQRFQSLAFQFFSHTEATHQLITPRERASEKFGIRTGDKVRFRVDSASYEGFVNRITKRATVLVEDDCSPLYSDGKRYAKFYVPIAQLELVR
ncbi:MAG: hypothetical protein HQ518_21980 [Rhodopirellula sp.]|nr:hypothetical protein [Rhodopirellula sp.]